MKRHKKSTTKRKNNPSISDRRQNRVLLILSASLFSIIGIMLLTPKDTFRKPNNQTSTTPAVRLYLSPNSQTISVDEKVTLDIYMDSLDKKVNGVQADLSYPTQSFEFESIDYSDSVFDMQLQSDGSDGTIKIARGSITPTQGVQKVATVNLRTIASSKEAIVNFMSSSSIPEANSATDMLIDSNNIGASLRIKN